MNDAEEHIKKYLDRVFVFSITWTFGGALDSKGMTMYDSFMSGILDMDLPNKSLYDSFLDLKKPGAGYRSWREVVPEF